MTEKRCYLCNQSKNLDQFEYIEFLGRHRHGCIRCNLHIKTKALEEKEKLRAEKNAFLEMHGITKSNYEKLEKISNIEAKKYIFSRSPKIANVCKFSEKLSSIVPLLLFFTFVNVFVRYDQNSTRMIVFTLLILLSFAIWGSNRLLFVDIESKAKRLIYKKSQCILKQKKTLLATSRDFYKSTEWRKVRRYFLNSVIASEGKLICNYCRRKVDITWVHVDHIKPRSLFPELALEFSNLTVSCPPCNIRKSDRLIEKNE